MGVGPPPGNTAERQKAVYKPSEFYARPGRTLYTKDDRQKVGLILDESDTVSFKDGLIGPGYLVRSALSGSGETEWLPKKWVHLTCDVLVKPTR